MPSAACRPCCFYSCAVLRSPGRRGAPVFCCAPACGCAPEVIRAWPLPTHALVACYSALFLRRSTMIPRNRTASTAHTIRTVELSIALSPFLTRINSASPAPSFRQVLEIGHHWYQFPYDLHGNRPDGHQEQGR